MRPLFRRLKVMVGLAVLGMAVLPPAGGHAQERFSTSPQASRWGKDYLPNLPVVDQDGREYRFYDDLIANKNVVINFIFTTCTDICPLTTARMSMVQEKLGDQVGSRVHMISITIDPEHDGPKELKNYAEAFRAGPGWTFLTGKPEDIAAIRYKLGERSKILSEHRHEMLLGSAASGTWGRDSVFGDIERVVFNIKSLDPNWRQGPGAQSVSADAGATRLVSDQPGQALFIKACSSCHTIGKGDRVGPDLNGVTRQRGHDWLKEFISRPDKVIARGDTLALALVAKYRGVRMPNLGLSEQDATDVMAYLDAQSYLVSAKAAGTNPAAGPHDHSGHHHHHK